LSSCSFIADKLFLFLKLAIIAIFLFYSIISDERQASLPKTYLMIVIMTRANDSAVRAVIRDTWLKLSSKGCAFMLFYLVFCISVLSARLHEPLMRFPVSGDAEILHFTAGVAVFRHIFPVGIANLSKRSLELLDEEQNSSGDLLFLDALLDDYANLARKTLMTIDAICHMYSFDFLLKVGF
uniref:Hexosyltransferase n=1 Tax=Parascaris equorum TaxID=6256 RepID=A0A914SHM9_PAREQ